MTFLLMLQILVTGSSGISFTASADHNSTVNVVDRYELQVVAQNPLGAIALTKDLGKPTPDPTNTITVQPIAEFATLTPGSYTATVSAVGPGGLTRSVPSDPFVRPGTPAVPGKPVVKR